MLAVMQPMAARFGRVASSLFFPVRDRKDLAPHARLLRAGVPVVFSSDLPVSPDPNPWPGIQVAVDDQVNGITLLAALRAYTAAGAYANSESRSGHPQAGHARRPAGLRRDPILEPARVDGTSPQDCPPGQTPVFSRL
jgi:predicted amidohydrolase YtcJ